jgi:hypothetical protein
MLTNWQTDLLLDAEAQTSDSATKTLDLPRDGHLAVLDLILEATNDTTANVGYSDGGTAGQKLLDVVTKAEIIANGSKSLLSVVSLEDLIAEAIRITGKIPARTITETLSEVQRIHVPIYFGRFIDDKLMVIPNGAFKGGNFFDSLQLKLTHALGVAANTKFVTGTFKITASVKKLVDGSPPEGKLVKTFLHKEDYTSVGSGTKNINLTFGNALFMRSIQVYQYEAGIAEGVDITKLLLEYNSIGGGKVTPFEDTWKGIQKHNAMTYGLAPLTFGVKGFFEDADTLATMVPDIKSYSLNHMVVKAAATIYSTGISAIAGDNMTVESWLISENTGPGNASAYATDTNMYWTVTTDVIPRYAYLDFDESKTMNDLLDTGGMTALVLKLTDGAAGATVRVNEEMVMRATDFRAS